MYIEVAGDYKFMRCGGSDRKKGVKFMPLSHTRLVRTIARWQIGGVMSKVPSFTNTVRLKQFQNG